jgi:hypothetical protein
VSRNGSRIDAMHATRSITSTSTVRHGGLSTSTMESCGRVGQNDRHHRGRGVNSTQVRAVDRVLRVHVIVRPLLSHADKFESSIRMQNTHRGSLHMTPLVLVQARASFLNLTR